MSYTSTAFHELYLFLINLDDTTIRVGLSIKSNYKAVAQRANLKIISNSGHWTSLGDYITEILEQTEDFLFTHGVRILFLDARNLACYAVVHIVGSELIEMSERVF